ncbi:hypothetical protein [Roseivirga pacifica]
MKKTKVLGAFLVVLFVSCSCSAQSDSKEDLIIGEWKAYKKELRGGKVETIDGGKEYKADDHMGFKADGIVENIRFELSFPYRVEGKFLYINREKFLIEELTEKRLIIVQHSDEMPEDPLAFRSYYNKVINED